eukprot:TRINITY_DN75736_c0_g1_i1.p1 TRINITY_DN75736_c0_g1~~TRINITY_DN75736_c0_g1_i1.p1  ORF type:complete len:994 (+),score=124.70 TRINITY_DN75736_c0_g1_i1:60-3041(+)
MGPRPCPESSVLEMGFDERTELPTQLLVSVKMPKLDLLDQVGLYICDLRMHITFEQKYYHHVHLPYAVQVNAGSAKYSRATSTLRVTLKVDLDICLEASRECPAMLGPGDHEKVRPRLKFEPGGTDEAECVAEQTVDSELANGPVENVNDQGQATDFHDGEFLGSACIDRRELVSGKRIRLVGLQAMPALNGQTGILVEYDNADCKWVVQMDDMDLSTYVKPCNLQLYVQEVETPLVMSFFGEHDGVATKWHALSETNRTCITRALATSLRRCCEGKACPLQFCAERVTRHYGGVAEDGSDGGDCVEELALVVAGPIFTELTDKIASVFATLSKKVSDVVFHTGTVERNQCPLTPGVFRKAYSRYLATQASHQPSSNTTSPENSVLTRLAASDARRLAGVLDPAHGVAWKDIGQAEKSSLLILARSRLTGMMRRLRGGVLADLCLIDYHEDWGCGDGDESFHGLCLQGHVPLSQSKELADLLRVLFERVSDLAVEVATFGDARRFDFFAIRTKMEFICQSCGEPIRANDAQYIAVHRSRAGCPAERPCIGGRICLKCEVDFLEPLYHVMPRPHSSSVERISGGRTQSDEICEFRWPPGAIRKPLPGVVNLHDSHPDVTCSCCKLHVGRGPVWKCAHRLDHQECDRCHVALASERDPSHVFIKMKTFGGGLQHMFPVLRDVRDCHLKMPRGADLFVVPSSDAEDRWNQWMYQYFEAVGAARTPPPPRPLRCSSRPQQVESLHEQGPRILLVKDFLSPEECDHFIRLGMVSLRPGVDRGPMQSASGMLRAEDKEVDSIVADVEARIGALVGISPHEDEDEINLVFRPESTEEDDAFVGSQTVVNIHLDARLGRPFTAATVLVYLNDVEFGGGTVFPCVAQSSTVRDAYAQAFVDGCEFLDGSTREGSPRNEYLFSIAETVARGGAESGGLVTVPTRGTAVAFWTINPRGSAADPWASWEREPHAWHGGVRVSRGGRGKWLLQKFKELPMNLRKNI